MKEKINQVLENFLLGIVTLFQSIVILITLGFYCPDWDFYFICWMADRRAEKEMGKVNLLGFESYNSVLKERESNENII